MSLDSGHVARLVRRSTSGDVGLRPRTASVFEPAPSIESPTSTWLEPPVAAPTAVAHANRVDADRPPPARTEPAHLPLVRDPLPTSGRRRVDGAPVEDSRPARAAATVARGTVAGPAPADDSGHAAETPTIGPPLRRPTEPAHSAELSSKHPKDDPAISVSRAESPATRTPPVDTARQRDAPPRAAAAIETAPTPTRVEPQGPRPSAAASSPPTLRHAAVDRAAPAPEVSVSIGRIEVVRGAPEQPRPPARPPVRASTAPALSDYLRERRAGR
jgi:hypothetical protein